MIIPIPSRLDSTAPANESGTAAAIRLQHGVDGAELTTIYHGRPPTPEARRHRIGSALIEAVVEWAKTEGLNRLLLDVAERNAPAMALYVQMGFLPNGAFGTLPPPRQHIREIQLAIRL